MVDDLSPCKPGLSKGCFFLALDYQLYPNFLVTLFRGAWSRAVRIGGGGGGGGAETWSLALRMSFKKCTQLQEFARQEAIRVIKLAGFIEVNVCIVLAQPCLIRNPTDEGFNALVKKLIPLQGLGG